MDCEQNGWLLVSLIGNTILCLISLAARRQSVWFFITLLAVLNSDVKKNRSGVPCYLSLLHLFLSTNTGRWGMIGLP